MNRVFAAFLITPLMPPIVFTVIFMFNTIESIEQFLSSLLFATLIGAPIGYLLMVSVVLPLWPSIQRLGSIRRLLTLSLIGLVLGGSVGLALNYLIYSSFTHLNVFVIPLTVSGFVAAILFWLICGFNQSLKEGNPLVSG